MKRYPAFDPPEYVDWVPDPQVMAEFSAVLERSGRRARLIRGLPAARLLGLYEGMLRFRLHDIALKRWVRQGILSKAWLGTGEEAVTIGNVHALRAGDLVGPMIRNAGACHEMGMSLEDLFRAYLGLADQITRGRDLHTGDPARGVIPPISFVASLVPVMTGMALASRIRGERRVALTWVGDGASRTGEFHEGLNFAAVQKAPLVIVLQDNGVALGTPREAHTRASFAEIGNAYGVPCIACEGNNILDVYGASLEAVQACREGKGPVVLLASTFRMGGHATHDEAEARALFPQERFTYWGRRDPIGTYETYLLGLTRRLLPSIHNQAVLREIEKRVTSQVEQAAETALRAREKSMPEESSLLDGVTALPGDASAGPAVPPCARVLSNTALKT